MGNSRVVVVSGIIQSVMCRKRAKLSAEQMQAIARAVADPRRFDILQQIARSNSTPCSSLKAHCCISPATISHHMKELSEAGLIDVQREGRTADLRFQREVWDTYLAQLAEL